MNKLVGRPIAKPEKLAVHERPQLEDDAPANEDAVRRLLDSRQELQNVISDLQLSDAEEDRAELAESERALAEVDAVLPKSVTARKALIEHLDWIDREGLNGADRLGATAHAFSTHINDLDPDADSDLIASGQELFAIINPTFKEIE